MVNQLLMSWDEYNKKKINLLIPYIFSIRNSEQSMVFFGADHSYDKRNLQFNQLREEWEKFLKETGGNNCLVLVESRRTKLANSEDEGIKESGESGFITFLANQKNIIVESPEPPHQYLFQEWTKQFSREYIYYLLVARRIQWHSVLDDENKKDLNYYFSKELIKKDQEETGWFDFDFSLEHIKVIHKNLFDTNFDENNEKFFCQISRPDKEISIINEVARAKSLIRNIYMVEQIERYWNEKKTYLLSMGLDMLLFKNQH